MRELWKATITAEACDNDDEKLTLDLWFAGEPSRKLALDAVEGAGEPFETIVELGWPEDGEMNTCFDYFHCDVHIATIVLRLKGYVLGE